MYAPILTSNSYVKSFHRARRRMSLTSEAICILFLSEVRQMLDEV
jgi:hypothetical protein